MKNVFISCRIRGDTQANLWDAEKYYRFAVEQGVAPLMPHLVLASGVLEDAIPEQRSMGLQICKSILRKADELWAIFDPAEGPSEGMKGEICLAMEEGIPVILMARSHVLADLKGADYDVTASN